MRYMTLLAVALLTLPACGSAPSAGDVPGDGPCRSEAGDEWYFYDEEGRIDRALLAQHATTSGMAFDLHHEDGHLTGFDYTPCKTEGLDDRSSADRRISDCLSEANGRAEYGWRLDKLRSAQWTFADTDFEIDYQYVGTDWLQGQIITPRHSSREPTKYRYDFRDTESVFAESHGYSHAKSVTFKTADTSFRMDMCLPLLRGRVGTIGHCQAISDRGRGAPVTRETQALTIEYEYADGRLAEIVRPDHPDTVFDYSCH